MKFRFPTSLFVVVVVAAAASTEFTVQARRNTSGSGRSIQPSHSRTTRRTSGRGARKPVVQNRSRRPHNVDDYDDEPIEEFGFGGFHEDDGYDEEGGVYDIEDEIGDDEYDFENLPSRRGEKRTDAYARSRNRPSSRGSSNTRTRQEPSSRSSSATSRSGSRRTSGSRSSGRIVTYGNRRGNNRAPQPSAFTRGLSALRDSIPDASSIKDSAFNSISAAKETTSKMSSNLYREIKGLTSSELEQVMLKATQPNDSPVKGKHVERLVGVTYQISGRYDIYDAVLRKLWSKMVEKDWRTTVKALYILHRFSADGAPDHQAALKARLRELRRTRDPKRKEKYFNSKQLLAGDGTPANMAYHAFLGRYAHYVLLRAQCFGGMFSEIANDPKNVRPKAASKVKQSRQQPKCITSTCLKSEHLEAAQMLLKAGLACSLKDEEECENTAIALERVVSDLIGLTCAVATALNNAFDKYDSDVDLDRNLVQKWCQFYGEELLPHTKKMVKSTSPTLDAYGLYLPSRMSVSVPQDLLQKGLKGSVEETKQEVGSEAEYVDDQEFNSDKFEQEIDPTADMLEDEKEANSNAYDEYEYDEYEYDDEEL